MHKELKNAFKSIVMKKLTPLGYAMNSDTIFARRLSPGVLGCVGYLTSSVPSAIKAFVGVRFERAENIYDELMKPFLIGRKSTPRYFPSMFRDLYELKKERSADPNFRSTESAYLAVEYRTVSDVADRLLSDVQQYGIPYVEFNASLSNATATISEWRGGGIGTVAYRLPIMYRILGRPDEAKEYLADTIAQHYPIGHYEKFAALLIARMDGGAAPSPLDEH
jgi:hypothetical protein